MILKTKICRVIVFQSIFSVLKYLFKSNLYSGENHIIKENLCFIFHKKQEIFDAPVAQ